MSYSVIPTPRLHRMFELTSKGLDHLIMFNDNLILSTTGGRDYLVLVELPSEPLYILGCLADLGCQTSRVSHLRIFLINIFHLPQGLAEERRESRRGTREERGKWLSVEIGSLQSSGLNKQYKHLHRHHRVLHTHVHCMNIISAHPLLTGLVINKQNDNHIDTQTHTHTHTSDPLLSAILCKFPLVSVVTSSCAALVEDERSPPSLRAAGVQRKGGLTLNSVSHSTVGQPQQPLWEKRLSRTTKPVVEFSLSDKILTDKTLL